MGIFGREWGGAPCNFLSKMVRLCQCVVLRGKGCGSMAYEREGWFKAVKAVLRLIIKEPKFIYLGEEVRSTIKFT